MTRSDRIYAEYLLPPVGCPLNISPLAYPDNTEREREEESETWIILSAKFF